LKLPKLAAYQENSTYTASQNTLADRFGGGMVRAPKLRSVRLARNPEKGGETAISRCHRN